MTEKPGSANNAPDPSGDGRLPEAADGIPDTQDRAPQGAAADRSVSDPAARPDGREADATEDESGPAAATNADTAPEPDGAANSPADPAVIPGARTRRPRAPKHRMPVLPPLPIGPRTQVSSRGKALVGPDGKPRERKPILMLMVGAFGVVFGDIGTSPLYSLQTVFSAHHNAVMPTESDVLGVISMVTWCLMLIVSFTYVGLILRADNQGEGGILSLAALVRRKLGLKSKQAAIGIMLAITGAALFYGDSLITPAISVLSAFEGLEIVRASWAQYVVPAAVTVLTLLFVVQRWGTGVIGKAFGPIMICWFLVIGVMGIPHLLGNLSILRALSPTYAVMFAIDRPVVAFIAMGAVVLSVTGAEALYADMGHFGRRPIALAWFCLIFPALLLNYYGQGAMILDDPRTVRNPFFELAPSWGTLPLVVLATAATVIASQAVISGAFSVSRQATRLSLLPRLKVLQTSKQHGGQIYVPLVNLILFAGVLALVLVFRSSERLASAYGLSVTGTLMLELSLFLLLALRVWNWPLWRVVAIAVVVGGLEVSLFAANLAKIASGGWLPLMIGAIVFVLMTTWKRGSRIMFGRRREMEGPIEDFVHLVREDSVPRVPGVAIYPHGDLQTTPLALRRNVQVNHVLHEHVVIVTVKNIGVPHVRHDARVAISDLGDPDDGIVHVLVRVGFNDSQDVPAALALAIGKTPELDFDLDDATYMLSVFRIEPGHDRCMPAWQKKLFRGMEKLSANRTQVLHLPPEKTTIMGGEAVL